MIDVLKSDISQRVNKYKRFFEEKAITVDLSKHDQFVDYNIYLNSVHIVEGRLHDYDLLSHLPVLIYNQIVLQISKKVKIEDDGKNLFINYGFEDGIDTHFELRVTQNNKEKLVRFDELNIGRSSTYIPNKYKKLVSGRGVIVELNHDNSSTDPMKSAEFIALIIGIDKYKGIWPALRRPVSDARKFRNTLENRYGFNEIIELYDENASRENIITELEKLTKRVNRKSNLLLFYAGHGTYDTLTQIGYIVPCDATSNSISHMISYNEIQTLLTPISLRAQHVLIISDACYSGALTRGSRNEKKPMSELDKTAYLKNYTARSTTAITSGSLEEVSDQSLFSEYLIKILKQNKKEYIDDFEIFHKLRGVSSIQSQRPIYKSSLPGTINEGGNFIFRKRENE